MRGLGRADIVNAGSGASGYSECGGPGRADIVNAGYWESSYSECRVRGRPDIVNAGFGGEQIYSMQGPTVLFYL
ncbi:unnamed protein product [Staurois parvus]|uniref:Uncharacterized protein n=1 Tax=Staurois parvus TaxID=386267 RepID=A0ABN9AR77_9NEOB|nr:unnamed protein product [Staurois parvus]